ncbi:DUF881 domain-containing protein [Nocardioidaceae bacterium]|nr:DUF881 domain-containing protein [Nocardioidaceae bacterium]
MSASRPVRPTRWRIALPVATSVAGLLVATSYVDADGTDLRAVDRRTDLADLVVAAGERVEAAQQRVTRLQDEVDGLVAEAADSAAGTELDDVEAELDGLRQQAGLAPVAGPGLTVVLDDAPDRAIDAADETGEVPVSDLVVHQQDIQAVANALWEGGAEAMTIRGQRVVATTGIKCVGNSVILHGVPYSPPYDISAVGDPAALRAALQTSSYVGSYREVADAFGLGYVVLSADELRMPAYTGTTALRHARRTTARG